MHVYIFSKNPAIFQLLEDNENVVEYDHISDECNWNILYQTNSPVSYFINYVIDYRIDR